MNQVITQNKIIKTKQVEKLLTANLYDNDIVEVLWDSSLTIIEVEHLSAMQEVVKELGDGNKMPLYFGSNDFLNISKAGSKYATSEEGVRYSLVIAVLVDNLAKRIIYNFFINFSKPKVPTRSFTNKQDAFVWLQKMNK